MTAQDMSRPASLRLAESPELRRELLEGDTGVDLGDLELLHTDAAAVEGHNIETDW